MDGNKIRFTHPDISRPFKILMLADTHLFRDDARGESYKKYSDRMAKAYNKTIHYHTGKTIDPEIAFDETLRIAKEQENSLLALIGDIFSYPSEAAIEWALEKLNLTNLPFVYTAGNHDWHYEGMDGSSALLRETWIRNRLLPFYSGRDPLMQKIEMNGVNMIVIDNSTYEISESQLQFLTACLSEQKPALLMLHIPLFAPGRPLGFGCGHPQWRAKNDKNYQLERRMPWREEGHTETTFEFYKTVFNATNLLGILAGHIHDQSIDIINGIPQIVTESNAEGGFLQVSFSATE
jgi:DNA repair exonuclease SbcCD nuclease subunit